MSEEKKAPQLTTPDGVPVGCWRSMSAGPRGPLLLEDHVLLAELQSQNRERIPERAVHAKGSGAFGTFTVTHDITKYTKAKVFSEVGKKTDIVARFSTVAGEKGAADAERDVRGFSVKFYTEEGNWDMVGNNTPVFFVRDPIKFPSFIRTQKRDPATHIRSDDAKWDFWSLCPESTHQVLILHSDRGLPASFRHMNGYGSHTFSLINKDDERVWCKFHFKTQQGIKNLTDEEAEKIVGKDRESHLRDLYESIDSGDFPKWTVYIQVMTNEQAQESKINPFDLTTVWSHKDYPLIEVGVMELNRNSDNYFADIEQVAFQPNALVPGIGPSPDKMLQARLFSYADAHHYRLGTNYHSIPVNQPRCPVMNYKRDGAGATASNYRGLPNYWPNSRGGPEPTLSYKDPAYELGQVVADRFTDEGDDLHNFKQPGDLYRMFDDAHKDRVATRVVDSLQNARKEVQDRVVANFTKADEDLGKRVGDKLAAAAAEKAAASK